MSAVALRSLISHSSALLRIRQLLPDCILLLKTFAALLEAALSVGDAVSAGYWYQGQRVDGPIEALIDL